MFMPPKAKISRDMIIEAAYEIVRESGEENMNARNIAEKLGCSTQPVLYAFKTMDEIRENVYQKADEFHSEYLMQMSESDKNPTAAIWKNYIRFSVYEKNLFRFLFQSNAFSGRIQGLIEDERLVPILQAMGSQMGMEASDVKKFFAALYYPVHGIASLLANNSMEYDEDEFDIVISMIKRGVLKELESEKNA